MANWPDGCPHYCLGCLRRVRCGAWSFIRGHKHLCVYHDPHVQERLRARHDS